MSGCGRKHRAKFLTRQFLNPTAWSELEPNEQLGICVEAPNGGHVRLLLLFPLHLPREKWSVRKGVSTSLFSSSHSCAIPSAMCVKDNLEEKGMYESVSNCLMKSEGNEEIEDHTKEDVSPTMKDASRSAATDGEITRSRDAPHLSTSPYAAADANGDPSSLGTKQEEECQEVTIPTTTINAVPTTATYGYIQDVLLPRKFHKVIWLAVKDVVVVVNEEEMKMKLSPDQLKYYMKQPQYILFYREALEECMKRINQMRREAVLQMPNSNTSLFASSSSTECVSSPSLVPKENQNRWTLAGPNNRNDNDDEEEEEEQTSIMVNANRRPHHRMYIYGDDEEEEVEEKENDEA